MKYGKKYADSLKAYDRSKLYDVNEAMGLVVETAKAKFDETIELTSVSASIPARQISRSAACSSFPTVRVNPRRCSSSPKASVQTSHSRQAQIMSAQKK